jgi:hypothetical protein
MASDTAIVAPPTAEVLMVDAEVVHQIRELHRGGWGAKRIARELELARDTVRRFLRRRTDDAVVQVGPRARQLDAAARAEARRLFDGAAEHNAVVVTQLRRERGIAATERVVQKVLAAPATRAAGAAAGHGALPDRAGTPDAGRFRPKARPARRAPRRGASARRGAELFAASLRQGVPGERTADAGALDGTPSHCDGVLRLRSTDQRGCRKERLVADDYQPIIQFAGAVPRCE